MCIVHVYIFDLINLFALQIFYAFNFTHLCLILLINWIPHVLLVRLCITMHVVMKNFGKRWKGKQCTIKYFIQNLKKRKLFLPHFNTKLLVCYFIVLFSMMLQISIFCVLSIFTFVDISINILSPTFIHSTPHHTEGAYRKSNIIIICRSLL